MLYIICNLHLTLCQCPFYKCLCYKSVKDDIKWETVIVKTVGVHRVSLEESLAMNVLQTKYLELSFWIAGPGQQSYCLSWSCHISADWKNYFVPFHLSSSIRFTLDALALNWYLCFYFTHWDNGCHQERSLPFARQQIYLSASAALL